MPDVLDPRDGDRDHRELLYAWLAVQRAFALAPQKLPRAFRSAAEPQRQLRDHAIAPLTAKERADTLRALAAHHVRLVPIASPLYPPRLARLVASARTLSPGIEVVSGDALTAKQRERTRARLARWLRDHLAARLEALFALQSAELSGASRGLAYQLVEALGSLPSGAARSTLKQLTPSDRKRLASLGVRFGLETVYIASLVKPQASRLRALLWTVGRGAPCRMPPAPGLASVTIEDGVGADFYEACGYRVMAGRAIRVDVLDRLAIGLQRAARKGPFAMTPQMINPAGLTTAAAVAVFSELGYAAEGSDDAPQFVRRGRNRRSAEADRDGKVPRRRRSRPRPNADSPFAKLRELQHPE